MELQKKKKETCISHRTRLYFVPTNQISSGWQIWLSTVRLSSDQALLTIDQLTESVMDGISITTGNNSVKNERSHSSIGKRMEDVSQIFVSNK